MEKSSKDMSFAEFSSLRQRKLNARESAAETAADTSASSSKTNPSQNDQIPQERAKQRLTWTQSRGYSQISGSIVLFLACIWALQTSAALLLSRKQIVDFSLGFVFDALRWVEYGGITAAIIDLILQMAYYAFNFTAPRLLVCWDSLLALAFVVISIGVGPKVAGCLLVLRTSKIILHLQIIEHEHSDEIFHLNQRLRASASAEKQARNQLNQATTKWKHEVQTKDRAEIQLRQYKDEVMMLQEALMIASKDMAKMQVLAGVAQDEDDFEASAGAGDDESTQVHASAELREEAKELLYAYINDLGYNHVQLQDEDEDTLISVLVQASESGIRKRIEKFMQAAEAPKRTKKRIIIREDGAFKKIE